MNNILLTLFQITVKSVYYLCYRFASILNYGKNVTKYIQFYSKIFFQSNQSQEVNYSRIMYIFCLLMSIFLYNDLNNNNPEK